MIRLRTLGGLALEGATIADSTLGRRPLALLALIAVAGPRGISRDKLVAYLWPERDDEKARNSLSQALSALRRDLNVDDVVLGSADLRLNAAVIESDVQEFAKLLEAGEAERAVGVYAGPFLDGVFVKGALEFERWVDDERQRLHHLFVAALESLGADAAQRGDQAGAIRWWRRRAQAEPLSSAAALNLMRALSNAGDSPDALRHFREHEAFLRMELGAAPDPRIVTFARELTAPQDVAPAPTTITESNAASPSWRLAAAGGDAAKSEGTSGARRSRVRTLAVAGLAIAAAVLGGFALMNRRDKFPVVAGITRLTNSLDVMQLDAAISPDGKFVAYSSGTLGRMRIVVQPVTGGPARTITDSVTVPPTPGLSGDHRWPRWAPDGLTIAFEAGRGIRSVSLFGGPTRVLVAVGQKPSWSPDGRHLLHTFAQGLWLLQLDSAIRRSIDIGTTVSGGAATWSVDGRRIAFVRGGTGLYLGGSTYRALGEKAQSSIWIADADGGNPIAITSEEHLNHSPAWGPDGRSVYFVSDREGVRDVYRQRIEPDGRRRGAAERLTTGASVHSFTLSRDGRQIAYSALERSSQIWMAPISDGETPFSAARQLTSDREKMEYISMSPDGRWIAYDAHRESAFQRIYKRSFDSATGLGEAVQVTADSADDFAPRWSPDNKEIVFQRIDGGVRDVFVLPADGRKAERVTDDPAQDYDPDWAPDGQRIVYRARIDTAGINQAIFVSSRDASGRWSRPQPVTGRGGQGIGQSVRWSPSGDVFLGGSSTLPVAGGEPRSYVDRKHLDGIVRFATWGRSSEMVYFITRDSVNAASYWRVTLPRGGASPSIPQRLLRLSDPLKAANHNSFDTDGRRLFFTIAADRANVFVARIDNR